MSKNKPKTPRQYTKPEIKKIRLDAEVLLVAGCKMAGGPNKAGGPKCTTIAACTSSAAGS